MTVQDWKIVLWSSLVNTRECFLSNDDQLYSKLNNDELYDAILRIVEGIFPPHEHNLFIIEL